jgi:hypothetical protein
VRPLRRPGRRIELWRDDFDWWNLTLATVLGVIVPVLRPKPPAG